MDRSQIDLCVAAKQVGFTWQKGTFLSRALFVGQILINMNTYESQKLSGNPDIWMGAN
jgi:hypothetical protein